MRLVLPVVFIGTPITIGPDVLFVKTLLQIIPQQQGGLISKVPVLKVYLGNLQLFNPLLFML